MTGLGAAPNIEGLNRQLVYGCETNDPKRIESALKQGADFRTEDDILLRWAATQGNTDMVRQLLSKGANPNAKDDDAFISACRNGHLGTAKLLLENGARVRAGADQALLNAVEGNNLEIARFLIASGANVNCREGKCLASAAWNGNDELTLLLLESGADPSAGASWALQCAIKTDNVKMVRLLIDRNADVRADGGYLLRLAVERDAVDCARELLRAGADVHMNGEKVREWPLVHAASHGQLRMMEILLEYDAHLSVFDTAALLKLMEAQPKAAEYLIQRGVYIHGQQGGKEEPLVWAATNGRLSLVKALTEAGARLNVDNSNALRRAIDGKHPEIIAYLVKQGEKITDEFVTLGVKTLSAPVLEAIFDAGGNVIKQIDAQSLHAAIYSRTSGVDTDARFTVEQYDSFDFLLRKGLKPEQLALFQVRNGRSGGLVVNTARELGMQFESAGKAKNAAIKIGEWLGLGKESLPQGALPDAGETDLGAWYSSPLVQLILKDAWIASVLVGEVDNQPILHKRLVRNDLAELNHDDRISIHEYVSKFLPSSAIGVLDNIRELVDEVSRVAILPAFCVGLGFHRLSISDLFGKRVGELDSRELDVLRYYLTPITAFTIFSDKTSADIIKFNRLFHQADRELPGKVQPVRFSAAWYPLFQPIESENGVAVVCLTSGAQLIVEGERLTNCLRTPAGFINKCITGRYHILSFRREGGSLAAAEVEYKDKQLRVIQFLGDHNGDPPKDAVRAFSELRQSLGGEGFEVCTKVGETDESKANHRTPNSDYENYTGFYRNTVNQGAIEYYGSWRARERGPALLNSANIEKAILKLQELYALDFWKSALCAIVKLPSE